LARNIPRPGGDEETAQSRFAGRGVTLGGDDEPSRVIEDPTATVSRPPPRVQRTLHLWQDGFSVDDGPLHRDDDPANQEALNMIHSGRAPLHLLNVQPGQEVDLGLDMQKDKAYVKPKAAYKPFSGHGQRLGSPTPGPSTTTSAPIPPTVATPTTGSSAAPPSEMNIDDSQPVIRLQIRLGDGTRLQSRFNTRHTIGDVYEFVDRANPASSGRLYSLMTTFPSKELDDRSAVLGELAELKRGGVVVQKWK
jgi:UBX domain-containing protein 1